LAPKEGAEFSHVRASFLNKTEITITFLSQMNWLDCQEEVNILIGFHPHAFGGAEGKLAVI